MIWVGGELVSDDALGISVLDRSLEHGLGLFETFRTWDGHATLLSRHLDRMCRSAVVLGLHVTPSSLPDEHAVHSLMTAGGIRGDARVRVTASGGIGDGGPSTVWMRATPLTVEAGGPGGIVLARTPLVVSAGDLLARHKTLNYWSRRRAFEQASRHGADEGLIGLDLPRVQGGFCALEGTRSNLFAVDAGILYTASDEAPILPGIMRDAVLEFARRMMIPRSVVGLADLPHEEFVLRRLDAGQVDEVFLTNSVWGIRPVREVCGHELLAPGPVTRRLWDALLPWLQSGGVER